MEKLIKTTLNYVFPEEVSKIIVQYCDLYNVINNKRKTQFQITTGYNNWFDSLYKLGAPSEYDIKTLIWQYRCVRQQIFHYNREPSGYYWVDHEVWEVLLKAIHGAIEPELW